MQEFSLKAVKDGDVYEHTWNERDLVDFGRYKELVHGRGAPPSGISNEELAKEQPVLLINTESNLYLSAEMAFRAQQ